MVRFQIQKKEWEIYLDDLKVAQRLAFMGGYFSKNNGSEMLENTDIMENTFNISVVNNAAEAENAVLIMAAYNKNTGTLDKLSISGEVFEPQAKTNITSSLRWLSTANCDVKAFFVKGIDTLESYRASLGAETAVLEASAAAQTEGELIEVTVSSGEEIIPVYPEGNYKALTMRYDDGTSNDRRLLEIFNANGIRGTFYLIPTNLNRGGESITDEEVPVLYAGHEIGNHTYSHQRPSSLTTAELVQEVESGKIYLERIINGAVSGFAYPYSEFGNDKEAFINCLKNTGHKYAITGTSSKTFDLPDLSKPYEIPFTIRHRENLLETAESYLALSGERQTLFFVMGHAHEFANDDNWELIEEFSQKMGGKSDIWYATNGEVIEYLLAQRNMGVPASGSSETRNLTNYTLWYNAGGRLVSVKPGDTLKVTEVAQ